MAAKEKSLHLQVSERNHGATEIPLDTPLSSHPPLLCSAHVKIDSQYFHIVHKLQMYATETPLKVLVCHDHKPHGMQASLWFP